MTEHLHLVGTWQASDVDPRDILAQLTRLWKETAEHELSSGRAVAARTNMLTLVGVAKDEQLFRLAVRSVEQMSQFHPSRAVFVLWLPEGARSRVDVEVSARCRVDRPGVCHEMVLFTVRGYSVLQLQSMLSLFILRDLPAYLWWLISSEESLDELSSLGSTVIIDSALWANSLQGLVMLQRRAQVQQVVDLAWLRLQPWRELVASVFDAPRERRILERCQEVSVVYGGVQRSGCWEVFLVLGWLASALQWRCQAIKWPGAPSDALTVRRGDNEISLRWDYAAQESDVGLQQILFRADEEQAVTIQRHLPNEAIVSVTGGNTRCVALRSVETSQALSLAFQQVEHDGAFQRTARWLISSGQAIGSVHA